MTIFKNQTTFISYINSYIGLGEREKALRSANKLYEIASSEGDDYYMGQALLAQALSYAYLGFF